MGRKICYISCEGHKSSNQANMFALSMKLFYKLKHGYAYVKKNPWKPFDCKNPKESNDTKVKPLLRWYQFMSNWNLCCANPWPDLKAISIGSMFCRRAKLVNRNLEESPLLEYHFLLFSIFKFSFYQIYKIIPWDSNQHPYLKILYL